MITAHIISRVDELQPGIIQKAYPGENPVVVVKRETASEFVDKIEPFFTKK